jgi:hypothetical protein
MYYIHLFHHIHTVNSTVIIPHLLIAGQLSGKNLPRVLSRESNSGKPYSNSTHFQLIYAAPYELHRILKELRRTLLSYAAPCPALPQPAELRRTLLSYAAPC